MPDEPHPTIDDLAKVAEMIRQMPGHDPYLVLVRHETYERIIAADALAARRGRHWWWRLWWRVQDHVHRWTGRGD